MYHGFTYEYPAEVVRVSESYTKPYCLNGISLEKPLGVRSPRSALVADPAVGACENQVNIQHNKVECAGLVRPVRLRVTNFACEVLGRAEPEIAQLLDVGGVVILQLDDGSFTFQWTGTQGGDNYVTFTNSQIDTPLKQEVIAFDAYHDDAGEAQLRAVVDGLARRICFSADRYWVGDPPDERLLSEDSERLIAEQVYLALLRQGGYDPEDWARYAESLAHSAP